MANRFERDFSPQIHEDRLDEPFSLPKDPCTVGVCFTGDLFGDWWKPLLGDLRRRILSVVESWPEHRWLFLTKNPYGLLQWDPFPDNAYVGVSVCNQRMFNHAVLVLNAVKAKNKWLSFEPLLDAVNIEGLFNLEGLSWTVIGAQARPARWPELKWVKHIVDEAHRLGIPVWIKDNMRQEPGEVLEQDIPL